MSDPEARLNEYDKTEWLDVARVFLPRLTPAELDAAWDEFQQAKADHERQKGLQ